MNTKNMELLFDYIFVARDTYKNGYAEAKQKLKEETEKAKRDFKGNRLQTEIAAAQQRFDDTVSTIKHEITDKLTEVISDTQNTIEARVRDVTVDFTLNNLVNLPLSTAEFDILAARYAGKHYFTDRQLLVLAEKNNISPKLRILPPVDEQLFVLREIETEFDKMFSVFDGDSYSSLDVLSNKKIVNWQNRFYGDADIKLPPDKQARRAFTAVMSKTDELQKGISLRNAVKSFGADDPATEHLLYEVSKSQGKFSDLALHYAGTYCMDVVKEFREGKRPAPDVTEKNVEDEKQAVIDKAYKDTGKALSAMAAQK